MMNELIIFSFYGDFKILVGNLWKLPCVMSTHSLHIFVKLFLDIQEVILHGIINLYIRPTILLNILFN